MSKDTIIEAMARAMCIAQGENPDNFHTRSDYEMQDRDGVMLTDHAFPLWRQPEYRKPAQAALTALIEGGWVVEDRNEIELLRIVAGNAPKPPIMETYGRAVADGHVPPSRPAVVSTFLEGDRR